MVVDERKIILSNGQICILRSPRIDDAVQMIEYLKNSVGETDFLLRYPEEVNITVEQEREMLQWYLESKKDVMIVAEIDGEVVGNCSFSQVGKKIRVRHRCSVGIALCQRAWGLGIGTALLELLITKAEECGYEQMELDVVSRNVRAIHLYEKMGFIKCGIRPNAIRHKDGRYDDDIIMVKQV